MCNINFYIMKAIEKLNRLSEKDLEHVKGGIYQPPTGGGDLCGDNINRKRNCTCTGKGQNVNDKPGCYCTNNDCVDYVVNPGGGQFGGEAPGYEGGSYLNEC